MAVKGVAGINLKISKFTNTKKKSLAEDDPVHIKIWLFLPDFRGSKAQSYNLHHYNYVRKIKAIVNLTF